MSAALQIAYSEFDRDFFSLPAQVQERINAKIDQRGLRLKVAAYAGMRGGAQKRLKIDFGNLAVVKLDAQPVGAEVVHGLNVGSLFSDGNHGNRRVIVDPDYRHKKIGASEGI